MVATCMKPRKTSVINRVGLDQDTVPAVIRQERKERIGKLAVIGPHLHAMDRPWQNPVCEMEHQVENEFLDLAIHQSGHIQGINADASSPTLRLSGTPTRKKSKKRYPPGP